MLKFLVVLSGLSLVFASCSEEKDKGNGQIIDPGLVQGPVAGDYKVEDPTCLTSDTTGQPSSWQYYDLREGETTRASTANTSLVGSPSLKGDTILHSLYGLEAQWQCTRNGDESSCGTSATIKKQPRAVKICRDDAAYSRESIESIGITSAYHIEELFSFYRRISSSSSLTNLGLMLMPSFATQYPGFVDVKTDNLSYFPSIDGTPYIVVFPKGKIGKQIWPNQNLWESAWVMAHEASHHIFRVEVEAASEQSDFDIASIMKNETIIKLPEEPIAHRYSQSNDLVAREVTVAELVGGANEGFADLFAFYALGGSTEFTQGLNCFATSRDISADKFGDGTLKSLNERALEVLFADTVIAPKPLAGILSCEMPNYQDVHAVGAVIVHGLDGLFREKAKIAGQSGNYDYLGGLALQWIRDMAESRFQGTEDAMRAIIEPGLEVAATDGRLNQAQCRIVERVFPVYYAQSWRQQFCP